MGDEPINVNKVVSDRLGLVELEHRLPTMSDAEVVHALLHSEDESEEQDLLCEEARSRDLDF